MFVGSYPPDSVGMVKAATEIGLKTKLFGGGMVGLQFASIMTALGPKLNGIVNYDFWVPEPTLKFEGVEAFLAKYQEAAKGKGVDPLGFYLQPYAYAYLQVLEQAINATLPLAKSPINGRGVKISDSMRTGFSGACGGHLPGAADSTRTFSRWAASS